ncbi:MULTISPECIES: hypothetical protein [unclassified Roseitalea]|uniref:hypothetical protein n=1 Tax=unclassified Roseitalea TaxID=2639107 RepID=UPI00273DD79D|nr:MULTISPECIES: hypothetical protein [unclassified Roseitalea]
MQRRDFIAAAAGALTLGVAGPARASDDEIRLRELYNKDMSFSPLAEGLEGDRVAVSGFMAPPLKANSKFFVLTKMPMAVCPFCETEAEWPDDILAVYTKRTLKVVPFNVPIVTEGVLELGTFRDPETGFLSRVRLANAVVKHG